MRGRGEGYADQIGKVRSLFLLARLIDFAKEWVKRSTAKNFSQKFKHASLKKKKKGLGPLFFSPHS